MHRKNKLFGGGYRDKFLFFQVVAIPILFIVVSLTGCASLKEGVKGFLGISTKKLYELRGQGIKRTFDFSYADAFSETKAILKRNGSYIYCEDKKSGLLALYVSEEDTTVVGVFLSEVGPRQTHLEVVSLSTSAKELIAQRIFSGLQEKFQGNVSGE